MRPSRFGVSGAVWRRRCDDIGSVADAVVSGRGRAGRDEDGRGSVGHIFDCRANLNQVVERLSGGVVVVSVNAEEVLLEAFVESVEDGVGGSQSERTMGG